MALLTPNIKATDTCHVGFLTDMVAGHVTHYRNIQTVVAKDATVEPVYNEIVYHKEGAFLEKLHSKVSFLPYYPFGVYRAGSLILKALHNNNYDVIYTNARVGVFFTPYFKTTPTVYDSDVTPIQQDHLEGYAGKPDILPIEKFKKKLFRDYMHSTKLILAWSEWARQSFIKDYGIEPEKVVVSPPGINLDLWQFYNREARIDEKRPVRILFVGGDFKRKGGEFLLDWFRQQPKGICELDIVTREPVEPREGIRLYYNMKPNTPELMQLYKKADIFVLPSLGECFGIATLEAMATGLPVIQTDVGGVHDIINNGVNGFIIKPKNLQSLGQSLGSLISDPSKRIQLGKAGRTIVESKFNLRDKAQNVINHLKSVSHAAKQAV
jgi:glycosyltransferase involved in cell wall biosynthesis